MRQKESGMYEVVNNNIASLTNASCVLASLYNTDIKALRDL